LRRDCLHRARRGGRPARAVQCKQRRMGGTAGGYAPCLHARAWDDCKVTNESPVIRAERQDRWRLDDPASNNRFRGGHPRGNSRWLKQIQARRECLEISIPGDEGNIGVNAALRDQGVAKPSFPFPSENLCAKFSGSVPETVLQCNQGEFQESLCHRGREFRVTQQFCQYRRRHYDLTGLKCSSQRENIVSLLSLKE